MKTTLQKGRKYAMFVPMVRIPRIFGIGFRAPSLKKWEMMRKILEIELDVELYVFAVEGLTSVQFVESNGNHQEKGAPRIARQCTGKSSVTEERCVRLTKHKSGQCPFHRVKP